MQNLPSCKSYFHIISSCDNTIDDSFASLKWYINNFQNWIESNGDVWLTIFDEIRCINPLHWEFYFNFYLAAVPNAFYLKFTLTKR